MLLYCTYGHFEVRGWWSSRLGLRLPLRTGGSCTLLLWLWWWLRIVILIVSRNGSLSRTSYRGGRGCSETSSIQSVGSLIKLGGLRQTVFKPLKRDNGELHSLCLLDLGGGFCEVGISGDQMGRSLSYGLGQTCSERSEQSLLDGRL